MEELFVPSVDGGGYYTRWNIELLPAINNKYILSTFDILILLEILMQWASHSQIKGEPTPLKKSYKEFAGKYKRTVNAVSSSVKYLLKIELIKRSGNGKRTAKFSYSPNVEKIRQILIDYVKGNGK
jgi:hypothetical protein